MNIVWQEANVHTKIFFRERQAVFWGFIFPVLLLVLFCSVFGGTPERSTLLVAGLICINVMSGALFATGVVMVAAREQGILRRYKAAPVALWKIITGLLISRLIAITLTTLLLLAMARYFYHILLPTDLVAMIAVYATGTLMFCAIAFAVASVARSVPQANGLVQVIFMPMMFLSGATFPYELMPLWMQKVAHVLPSSYYVAGLKSVMLTGGGLSDNAVNLAVMGAFILLSVGISIRFFRWE
jgi:ABC-2 type transport system permease protein